MSTSDREYAWDAGTGLGRSESWEADEAGGKGQAPWV